LKIYDYVVLEIAMDWLMILWAFVIGTLVGVIGGLILVYRTAVSPLHTKIQDLSTVPENYAEVMEYYPYHQDNFRFLGTPISGIQFEDDDILFISFVKDSSERTPQQKRIKQLIDAKKVSWVEFTMP